MMALLIRRSRVQRATGDFIVCRGAAPPREPELPFLGARGCATRLRRPGAWWAGLLVSSRPAKAPTR